MTIFLDALGWPAGLACFVIAGRAAWRGRRAGDEEGRALGALVTTLIFLAAGVADFTAIGVLAPVMGGILAGLAAAAALALLRPWERRGATAREAWGHAAAGAGWLRDDARSLWGRLRGRFSGGGGDGHGAGEIPLEAVADYAASRAIPSLMEDAALGAPAEPAAIAEAGIPVPPPWAQLAQWIRDREPADDAELRMFHEGDAAGALAVADARHAYGETLLNAVGLSAAYVAGELEAADSMAEHASLLTQVGRRFGVIYGALKEWVDAHGHLPHKGDFLTGD